MFLFADNSEMDSKMKEAFAQKAASKKVAETEKRAIKRAAA